MHFKTPIQVYIERNVISTTVRTRNEEKKFSNCCTYNILFNINLYRCFKMHIRNYFQIFKIEHIK